MPRTNIDSELRARVESFVADLSEIIRRSALESVREALGAEGAAPVRAARRVARTAKAAGAPRKSARGGRVRRSSADLERLSADFLSYVKAHSGERLEQIGIGMGVPTKELKRPVQLLLEAGQVRTEGQRRGTRYFAGAGSRPATKSSRKRKVSRKKGKTRRKTASRKKGGKKA